MAPPAVLVFDRTPWIQPAPPGRPEDALEALRAGGALRRHLATLGEPQLLTFDVTGQRLGSPFVKELCNCLAAARKSPMQLMLGHNDLTDGAGQALSLYFQNDYVGMLRRVVLERNELTVDGAHAVVAAVAALSQRVSYASSQRVFVDVTFNSVADPRTFLDEVEKKHQGAHAPCSHCEPEWCAL